MSCRFLSEALGGTTPKFNCVLPDGEVVKVKYGRNAEIPAEAAATRLLAGLGFGADRIYIVPRLRCHGCPPLPFHISRVFGFVRADSVPELLGPDARVTEYEWVAVERRMEGRPIEADGERGWAWFELAANPAHGGADRAEIDAFRLWRASSCTGTTSPTTSASCASIVMASSTSRVRTRSRSSRISARASGRTKSTWTDGAARRCGAIGQRAG